MPPISSKARCAIAFLPTTVIFKRLLFVTQQYLNGSLDMTKELIRKTVLQSPEPLTINEYIKLVELLESD
ncbi:hypothetical protein [Vibrio tapetis]|uniref:Uncharacterized protein n=2 Tax=Vibrio tapetis TaxID=52443 RepID=A0A2N8ZNL6_9VIBR|nr:hypothetical protein [Vibrio tapetis]ACB99657.1 conserved protein [Vibrio tapetis]MDN3683180.1 hypothetical protein [Vibrio tapetis subsp. quintayensis]SON51453.1 conserved protein of unknown function [Vibrio tapetis subsp. tapetis]SON53514.1 conserved protein of unknown function [Vibrio tapetis subsp. tapetis]